MTGGRGGIPLRRASNMSNAQDYLTGLAQLHKLTNDEDRRAVWRQGLAALATVRVALMSGLVDDVGFLSKPLVATALFELAAAVPAGVERTDLGRRISV